MTKPAIKNFIKADQAVVTALDPAKEAFAVYQAKYILLADELHPAAAIERLTGAIKAAPTTTQRQALQDQIGRFSGPGAGAATHAARVSLMALWPDVKTCINALLDAALKAAHAYVDEVVDDESALFSKWGYPTHATVISANAKMMITELESLKEGAFGDAALPWVYPAPDSHAVLEWFQ